MKDAIKVILLTMIMSAFFQVGLITWQLNTEEDPQIEQLQTEVQQLQTQVDTLNARVEENDKIVNRWLEEGD